MKIYRWTLSLIFSNVDKTHQNGKFVFDLQKLKTKIKVFRSVLFQIKISFIKKSLFNSQCYCIRTKSKSQGVTSSGTSVIHISNIKSCQSEFWRCMGGIYFSLGFNSWFYDNSLHCLQTHPEEFCYKDENDRQRDKSSCYSTVVALSSMSYESCSAENIRCLMWLSKIK